MHAVTVLDYLPKLKRRLGLAFAAHFLYDFSIKMLFIWYSIYGQCFNVTTFFQLFSFSNFFPKCFIEFLFRQLMTSWTWGFIFDHPINNGRQVEKKGRTEIQTFEYLKNEKSFLDEIKSIFRSFWRTIIWWKK